MQSHKGSLPTIGPRFSHHLSGGWRRQVLPCAPQPILIVGAGAYADCFQSSCVLFDHLDSFCQLNRHGDNTSQVFYFCSVLSHAAGNRRRGMGDERQPFRVLVQFTPAADVGIPGHEEVNRSPKFLRPVFPRRDGAFLGIDVQNCAWLEQTSTQERT
jgi:hypothetical protein